MFVFNLIKTHVRLGFINRFLCKVLLQQKKATSVGGMLDLPENLSRNHYVEVVTVYKQVVQTLPHDNINFTHNLPNDNDGIYRAAGNPPLNGLL
jgi:glutamine cyclotransferase